MSKAIKELERKKREEERKKTMQKYYEPPKTPPYAPSLHSSNPVPRGAVPIVAALNDAIKDEGLADAKYAALAHKLDEFGLSGAAAGVILIAADERRHKQTLENILREVEAAIKRRVAWVER